MLNAQINTYRYLKIQYRCAWFTGLHCFSVQNIFYHPMVVIEVGLQFQECVYARSNILSNYIIASAAEGKTHRLSQSGCRLFVNRLPDFHFPLLSVASFMHLPKFESHRVPWMLFVFGQFFHSLIKIKPRALFVVLVVQTFATHTVTHDVNSGICSGWSTMIR